MSEIKKMMEMQSSGGFLMVKVLKWLGWFFIIMGGFLTITIIAALAGIPLILMGIFLVWFSKRFARTAQAFAGASAEAAEIQEHNLRVARAANKPADQQ